MSITEKSLWIVFIQIFVPQCSLRDSPYIFHRHCALEVMSLVAGDPVNRFEV